LQRDRGVAAAHFGALVCSLLASLPECFANKHTQIGLLSKRQQLGKIDYDKSVNQPGSKLIVHASILKSSVPNNFIAVVTYAIILASTLIVERNRF